MEGRRNEGRLEGRKEGRKGTEGERVNKGASESMGV